MAPSGRPPARVTQASVGSARGGGPARGPSRSARLAAEELTQLFPGALELSLVRSRQSAPGAVGVEIEHRHRGLERRAFATAAALRGPLQGGRDPLGVPLEDPALEVEGVAAARHFGRPVAAARATRRLLRRPSRRASRCTHVIPGPGPGTSLRDRPRVMATLPLQQRPPPRSDLTPALPRPDHDILPGARREA